MQASQKNSWLDTVLRDLRRQHGAQIVRSLAEITRFFSRRLSTTYPELNAALGGGLPRGQLVEFIGRNSTGMATVALRIAQNAQYHRQQVAYIDCQHTFDPSYAQRHGLAVESLLLVRPQTGKMGLGIAKTLIASGECKVVIFDALPDSIAERSWMRDFRQRAYQLILATRKAQAVVIFLNSAECQFGLVSGAAVRLEFQRQRWLWHRDDVIGCRTRVTILKNKGQQEQHGVTLAIRFNPDYETDTTWW